MVKKKKIFSAFIRGKRYFLIEILFACMFFSIIPLMLYVIIEKDNVILAIFLLIGAYPIYRNVMRKYVEVYDDNTYGIYLYIFGLKFGKKYIMPELDHIYLYRTTVIGNAMTQNYNISTIKGEFVALELFDKEENVILPIYCSDETYIDKKSSELSKIFDLEIRDNRGREMEVYKA